MGLWRHLVGGAGPVTPPDADVQPPDVDLGYPGGRIGKFVFLSHTSVDALAIGASIIPVLAEEGFYDVHFSNRAQAPQISSLYKARLLTSLARCRWFMVFVTQASIKSEWVQFEVDWASRHRSHDEVIVVTSGPVRVKSLNRWLARAPHVAFDRSSGTHQDELRKAVGMWAKRRDAGGQAAALQSK